MKNETDCPVAAVAALLSDAWTMRIIHNLLGGGLRFCELERSLAGISTRTLTLKLKHLEAEGIVEKLDAGYRLTKRGAGLRSVIRAMERFGKKKSP
jgi:DNA-binding HxlR family transcriptional regulator